LQYNRPNRIIIIDCLVYLLIAIGLEGLDTAKYTSKIQELLQGAFHFYKRQSIVEAVESTKGL